MSSIVTKTTMTTIVSSTGTTAANDTAKCRLLELPAELRNRIWAMVAQGDSPTIDMSRGGRKARANLTSRRNLVITCKQIHQEADLMFFAINTFVFRANDRRVNYGGLDTVADWLGSLTGKQRDTIGEIVICTKKQAGMVNWSWVCAGYCDMDFGFEVGGRMDREIWAEVEDGEFVLEGHESWGKENHHSCGKHVCTKSHYMLVDTKKTPKKGLKKY